jgi:hypothetical protein
MTSVCRWGPCPWLLGAEIFPIRARAKGMALSTSSNWLSNFIIAFITPPLFDALKGGYYFLLMGFCVISGIFVYFVYPETAHTTLERLGEVFGDKTTDEKPTTSLAGTSNLAVDGSVVGSASQVTLAASTEAKSQVDVVKEEEASVISDRPLIPVHAVALSVGKFERQFKI